MSLNDNEVVDAQEECVEKRACPDLKGQLTQTCPICV
jgi:hypothetical protein